MRMEVEGTVILYSADLGTLNDLDMAPTPIDWLLVESSHVALEELWPWVNERGIKRCEVQWTQQETRSIMTDE